MFRGHVPPIQASKAHAIVIPRHKNGLASMFARIACLRSSSDTRCNRQPRLRPDQGRFPHEHNAVRRICNGHARPTQSGRT